MLHLIENAKHCGARSETPQVSRHTALIRLNQIMLDYAAARYCSRVFRLASQIAEQLVLYSTDSGNRKGGDARQDLQSETCRIFCYQPAGTGR
jgi:hypothetical protein